jgi:probable HAF family extracellular repeat protein
MKTKRFGRVLSVAGLLCLATAMATAQQYNMVILGPYGSLPITGLNNNGDVVGYNSLMNTAFLYTRGAVTSLGLGHAAGTTINNGGQMILYSSTMEHSFVISPPRVNLVDLGTLGGGGGLNGGGYTYSTAMNDSGTIVGQSNVTSTVAHAFVYANGHMSDLGSLGSNSLASAINSSGQIVGSSVNLNGYTRAFQMVNGTMTDLDPGNLAYDSYASAINDSGQIVVVTNEAWHQVQVSRNKLLWVAYRGSTWYTLVYNGGINTNIGNLGAAIGTFGGGLNKYGDVVGMTYVASSVQHAFLVHAGIMIDLNNHVNNLAGWTLWEANNINDLGQIVCLARGPDGVYQIVLLVPENFGV